MNKLHILGGALLFVALRTGVLSFWHGYNGQSLDWLPILREFTAASSRLPGGRNRGSANHPI